VTNYYVTVYRFDADDVGHPETNRWFAVSELAAIPLTGLARKVLKRLKALPGYTGGQPLVRLDEVAPELSQ
jgi:A/G-specific adenine glycosylase